MNLDNLKVQRGKNGWTPEQVTQAEKIAIKKADTYNTVTTRRVRPDPERINPPGTKTGNSADLLGLYGQVNKRIRWMPRQ
jgi:hypothetical protein